MCMGGDEREMKILHVINSLSMGGAEKLVADLAPLQRERGRGGARVRVNSVLK